MNNTAKNVTTFFKTLKPLLAAKNKTIYLSVDTILSDGPTNLLSELFKDFDDMFDGVKLMAYTTTQYLLNANNNENGIHQWLGYVKKEKIHLGLWKGVDYTDPGASTGDKYDIPKNSTNGQAAAYIYHTLMANLEKIDKADVPIGMPFFWDNNPAGIADDTFMTDFAAWKPPKKEENPFLFNSFLQ